jgi:hypothetical protein
MSDLVRWVNDVDLTDEKALENISLPTGVTLGDICDASTDYLWRASAGRYNAHEVRIRPHRLVPSCQCAGLLDPTAAFTVLGRLDGADYGCSCQLIELRLDGPASDIVVTVDGVQLSPSDWLLVDGYRLIRVGGYWPCCQSLTTRDGEPGTWSVVYVADVPPPALGRLAARELAIEVALYHSNKPSKLPKGTTSITRTGIAIQLQQPRRRTDSDASTTGLPTVELFLDAVNPGRQRRRPMVFSPDTLVGGRTS